METNWSKVSAIATVIGTAIAAIMLGLYLYVTFVVQAGPQTGHPPSPNPLPWWPIVVAGGCIVASGLLHYRAAQIQANAKAPIVSAATDVVPRTTVEAVVPRQQSAKVSHPQAVSRPAGTTSDGRIFIAHTPQDLVAPFRGNLTNYQASKLSEDLIEKWVCWTLTLGNIDEHRIEDTGYAFVSSSIRDDIGMADVSILMVFDGGQRKSVLHLAKGAVIQMEGRIASMDHHSVSLRDCRLVTPLVS